MFVGDLVMLSHDSRCFFSLFFRMDVPFTGMTCPLQGKDSQTRGHGQESSKKSKIALSISDDDILDILIIALDEMILSFLVMASL